MDKTCLYSFLAFLKVVVGGYLTCLAFNRCGVYLACNHSNMLFINKQHSLNFEFNCDSHGNLKEKIDVFSLQVTGYLCKAALCVLWPFGNGCPVLYSQLQDGPVVHVTSVSANGRAKPVSSTALSLSVRLATNSLGPQLS